MDAQTTTTTTTTTTTASPPTMKWVLKIRFIEEDGKMHLLKGTPEIVPHDSATRRPAILPPSSALSDFSDEEYEALAALDKFSPTEARGRWFILRSDELVSTPLPLVSDQRSRRRKAKPIFCTPSNLPLKGEMNVELYLKNTTTKAVETHYILPLSAYKLFEDDDESPYRLYGTTVYNRQTGPNEHFSMTIVNRKLHAARIFLSDQSNTPRTPTSAKKRVSFFAENNGVSSVVLIDINGPPSPALALKQAADAPNGEELRAMEVDVCLPSSPTKMPKRKLGQIADFEDTLRKRKRKRTCVDNDEGAADDSTDEEIDCGRVNGNSSSVHKKHDDDDRDTEEEYDSEEEEEDSDDEDEDGDLLNIMEQAGMSSQMLKLFQRGLKAALMKLASERDAAAPKKKRGR